MPLTLNSTGGGSITLTTPSTASTLTVTLPNQTQTLGIVSGTAQASTSGTNIDFTGIPSWVKRITVMFNGVSTSGTSPLLIQLGVSGTIDATGYVSVCSQISGTVATNTATTGYAITYASVAANLLSGQSVLSTQGSNVWVSSATCAYTDRCEVSGGTKTLSGTLDRIRITTVNGTDTFDAGSINILYEG